MADWAMILLVVFSGTNAGSASSTPMASEAACKSAIERVRAGAENLKVHGVCVSTKGYKYDR